MPDILKPDMKALVWMALGFLVLPKAMAMVAGGMGSRRAAPASSAE